MANPNWRQMIVDQNTVVAAGARERNNGASDTAHISRVGFSVGAHRYLVKAAHQRGISISGYIRRATLAVVAMELGLEATDLFDMDTMIAPVGRGGSSAVKDLDGKIYGRWEVIRDERINDGDPETDRPTP